MDKDEELERLKENERNVELECQMSQNKVVTAEETVRSPEKPEPIFQRYFKKKLIDGRRMSFYDKKRFAKKGIVVLETPRKGPKPYSKQETRIVKKYRKFRAIQLTRRLDKIEKNLSFSDKTVSRPSLLDKPGSLPNFSSDGENFTNDSSPEKYKLQKQPKKLYDVAKWVTDTRKFMAEENKTRKRVGDNYDLFTRLDLNV